jgi:SAM-dependent methyltransferase
MYSDADAAALYDVLNRWGPSDDFYLELAMASPAVLDVGCGTGALLRRARAAAHTGRLVGVDPDRAMLDVARRRSDIEWREGTAASMAWDREFELAVMTGHAFQFLVDDDELRRSLAAIRRALVDGGQFVFETRNPAVREWEAWNPSNPIDVVDPTGRAVRITYEVQAVDGELVVFTETTTDPDGRVLRVDPATLRFLDADPLRRFLTEAGLTVDAQYGGWHGETLAETSREIVTFARRTGPPPTARVRTGRATGGRVADS